MCVGQPHSEVFNNGYLKLDFYWKINCHATIDLNRNTNTKHLTGTPCINVLQSRFSFCSLYVKYCFFEFYCGIAIVWVSITELYDSDRVVEICEVFHTIHISIWFLVFLVMQTLKHNYFQEVSFSWKSLINQRNLLFVKQSTCLLCIAAVHLCPLNYRSTIYCSLFGSTLFLVYSIEFVLDGGRLVQRCRLIIVNELHCCYKQQLLNRCLQISKLTHSTIRRILGQIGQYDLSI